MTCVGVRDGNGFGRMVRCRRQNNAKDIVNVFFGILEALKDDGSNSIGSYVELAMHPYVAQ